MKTFKKMFGSKKAFSEVLAALIMMLLAVAAGVVVYAYVMGWIGGATTNPRQSGHLSFDSTYANVTGSKITLAIRNVGGTTRARSFKLNLQQVPVRPSSYPWLWERLTNKK